MLTSELDNRKILLEILNTDFDDVFQQEAYCYQQCLRIIQ